jgi:hypothetical protein
VLCETYEASGDSCSTSQFISNQRIVAYGSRGLRVLDLSGVPRFEQTFEDGWIDIAARPILPSAAGNRFAAAFNRPFVGSISITRGELPAALPDRVQIFDLPRNEWIYVLQDKRHEFKQIWGLGLSPSGQKLLIDSGGIVQLYALPSATGTAPEKH